MSWIALTGWALVALGSAVVWFLTRSARPRPWWSRGGVLVAVLAVEVVGTAAVAVLAAAAPPLPAPGRWGAVAVGAVAAVLSGGVVATTVLGLADATYRVAATRAQPNVLRGGAWIGGLERLALFGTLLAGWPDGLVAIVAVKAFARYPELKTGQATGAIERFIIGTFASLGWAATCAGVMELLR